MAQAKVKSYLAFAPIGCGSSWYRDGDISKAIAGVEKQAKIDWKHIYSFSDGLNIYIYDITGLEGWYASHDGLFPKRGKDEPEAWTVVNGESIKDKPKALEWIATKFSTYYDEATDKVIKVAKPILEYA